MSKTPSSVKSTNILLVHELNEEVMLFMFCNSSDFVLYLKAEEQLREKVQEFIELQNKYDNERTDLILK